MRRALNLSLLDQGLLSAFSLALNLLLIAWSDPASYGQFVLLFSLVLLLLSAQSALILTPINILLPGRPPAEQHETEAAIGSLNRMGVWGAALVGILAWALFSREAWLLPAVAGYASSSLAREYWRGLYFVRGESARAFALDLSFVLFSIAAIWGLLQFFDPVTASIGGMALGNGLAILGWTKRGRLRPLPLATALLTYRQTWRETRWALLGAAQTEAQMRGYVLIVEAWRGAAALGALQAGRVVSSALTLAGTAWARVARPRMVEDIQNGRDREALSTMWKGIALTAAGSVLYGLVVLAAWPLLEAVIFGTGYENSANTVALWWLHSALVTINGVISTLLLARRQFRQLTLLGMATAVAAILGLMLLAMTQLSIISVLHLMIGVELAEAAGLLWLVWRGTAVRAHLARAI